MATSTRTGARRVDLRRLRLETSAALDFLLEVFIKYGNRLHLHRNAARFQIGIRHLAELFRMPFMAHYACGLSGGWHPVIRPTTMLAAPRLCEMAHPSSDPLCAVQHLRVQRLQNDRDRSGSLFRQPHGPPPLLPCSTSQILPGSRPWQQCWRDYRKDALCLRLVRTG